MTPRSRYDVDLDANTRSLQAFSVVVTVQAVNHLYRHSPPSAPVMILFSSNDSFTPTPTMTFTGELENQSMTEGPVYEPESKDVIDSVYDSMPVVDVRQAPDAPYELGLDNVTDSVVPGPVVAQTAAEEDSSDSDAGLIATIVALAILALILLVLLLLALLLCCRRRRRMLQECVQQPLIPATPERVVVAVREPPPCPPRMNKNKSAQTFDHSFYVTKHRRRTPVSCLRRDYEDRLRPNCHYAMKREFDRVPSGPTDIADDATAPHNAPLNRSQNAIPYDKNRVRLAKREVLKQPRKTFMFQAFNCCTSFLILQVRQLYLSNTTAKTYLFGWLKLGREIVLQ